MRLASAQQVLTLMSVQSSTGTEAAANMALDLSFPLIESLLDTRLTQSGYVDFFNYGDLVSRYAAAAPTVLWLTSRFLLPGGTITVRESTTDQPLRTSSDGTEVSPDDYYLNTETGELTLFKEHRRGQSTISVAYTAGFTDDGTAIDDQSIPAWLHSGAVTAAIHVLNTHPSTPANRKTPYAEEMSRMLRGYLYGIFAPHFRSRVNRLMPARSVMVSG